MRPHDRYHSVEPHAGILADEAALHAALQPVLPRAVGRRRLLDRASSLARDWPQLGAAEVRQMLLGFLSRVSLHADRIDLYVRPDRLARLLTMGSEPTSTDAATPKEEAAPLILSGQASLRRAGREIAMVIGADPSAAQWRIRPCCA